MSKRFDWPLAQDSFTFLDRARIALWQLTTNQFTMGPRVQELESKMSKLAGAHALMVANGSLANQLVFELWKLKNPGEAKDALVIVPAVTWVSSITPILSLGFDIEFCDVNLTDFAFDYDRLEDTLKANAGRRIIIWPTALIGFTPDMARLKGLAAQYGADLFLDACENTLAYTDWNQSILASADMVTTSTYFSHMLTTCEGGFVFFGHLRDYEQAKMLRNHGLTRSLESANPLRHWAEVNNPTVDPDFLFAVPGTNLRPTDVHAMFGLQDIKRVDQYRVHRTEMYRRFHDGLDKERYYLPPLSESHVGFCLPIIVKLENHVADNGATIARVKRHLRDLGIQTRPLIGGCLLMQPIFRQYGRAQDYPKAQWLHYNAGYVGLHSGVTEEMVDGLVEELNEL